MTFLKGIGPREAVALVVLAVGLALGVAFCSPDSTGGSPEALRRQTLEATTPVEGVRWSVTWLEGADLATAVVVGQGEAEVIDMDFGAGPFPDVPDDQWGVIATATIAEPAGRVLLDLSYKGEIALLINGEDRGVSPATGEGTIVIPMDIEEGAPVTVVLRLRDAGGEARLKAQFRR